MKCATQRTEFLNVTIHIIDGHIATDVYTKPTDKFQYLHAKSDHPINVKKALPYTLAIIPKTICLKPQYYKRQTENITRRLKERGYKETHINAQIQKVDKLDRRNLIHPTDDSKPNRNKDRVTFPITYSISLPDIPKILTNNMRTLHKSQRCKKAFRNPPMVAWRKGRDIGSQLVHSKHHRAFIKEATGSRPCQSKRCAICPYMEKTDTFQGPNAQHYKIIHHINCKSANLVYAIRCSYCEKIVYVGETGDTIYTRMQNHLSQIRRNNKYEPVPIHFNGPSHSIKHFRIIAIEKLYTPDKTYRQLRIRGSMGVNRYSHLPMASIESSNIVTNNHQYSTATAGCV